MTGSLSSNTQAILLLTAPLNVGRSSANPELLGAGEYKRLAQHLRAIDAEPADLLRTGAIDILESCGSLFAADRLQRLLARGLLLSQAVEHWRARAIWVVSRADAEYPQRLKTRLRGGSPVLLYGCGDEALLDRGGLAVVGSRHAGDALIDYAIEIGRMAAKADQAIISGGAKGIDQAAMRGSLESGGMACGVLADSLERQVLAREHRNMIMDGRLTLVSPYDPKAGFNVGHAMQRNKSIYALADASLVVSSDVEKGGTWTGAVEQLEKLHLVPVYVRSTGVPMAALDALRRKGALAWPNPSEGEALKDMLTDHEAAAVQTELAFTGKASAAPLRTEDAKSPVEHPSEQVEDVAVHYEQDGRAADAGPPRDTDDRETTPADIVFAGVRQAITTLLAAGPMKDAEVAGALRVAPAQASSWLNALTDRGVLEKRKRPARYALKDQLPFD